MVICLSERIIMSKKNKPIHNQKHLTLSDRTFIEQELVQGRLAYILIMKHLIAHLIPYNSDEYCIISYFYSQTMI